MSGCNFRRRSFLVTSLALAGGLLFATFGVAGKPGGGGGGSGNTGGGTIYFSAGFGASFGLNSMNSDGRGKTALPLNVRGTPSRLLHGGHRWFLTSRRIVDETYPNGGFRQEKFAVRDDGNEDFTVQLTDDPDLQFLSLIWAPGETADAGFVSGFARRWVFDGVDWVIDPDSVGIYTATVLFDEQGNVTGLAAAPAPLVSVGVVADEGEWWPAAYNWHFDWSPDLTEIVYSNADRSALLTLDLITGEVWTLTTGNFPWGAKWSPAGNLIVFSNGSGNIETIAWDGTGRKEIIRADVTYYYLYPDISPTGSHIVYARIPHGSLEGDLYRATISGATKVNLTKGIAGFENSAGWR
jgi:hypothetical protein